MLLLYPANYLSHLTDIQRLVAALVAEHCLLALSHVYASFASSPHVHVQNDRNAFILSKVIHNIRDDEDDPSLAHAALIQGKKATRPDLVIQSNDDDFRPLFAFVPRRPAD